MAKKGLKLLVYAAVAAAAYLTGASFGAGAGFATFIVLGIVAELLFWIELFRPDRDTGRRGPRRT